MVVGPNHERLRHLCGRGARFPCGFGPGSVAQPGEDPLHGRSFSEETQREQQPHNSDSSVEYVHNHPALAVREVVVDLCVNVSAKKKILMIMENVPVLR